MKTHKPQPTDWLMKFLNLKLAVVEVNAHETEEEAWQRHITNCPEQIYKNVRIFNRRCGTASCKK